MDTSMTAGVYSIVAVAVTITLVVMLHKLEPEFDPSLSMLSEYSLGGFGVLMRIAFIVGSTSVMACALSISSAAGPWAWALVVVALGPLGAAFVDTDPIATGRSEVSRRGNVHVAFGMLFILGFPIAATMVGISAAGDPSIGSLLMWASIVPWLGLVVFLGIAAKFARQGITGGSHARIGWPNRINMLAYLAWVVLVGLKVLA